MRTVLYNAAQIAARIRDVAAQISKDYTGREIDLVCLVNGAATFSADLARLIDVPVRRHFLGFSPYADVTPSGEVRITLDVPTPLYGRHVLVTEGIVVSGRTPKFVMDLLRLRGPASLEMCAIGLKPANLAVDLNVRYSLFKFGDEIAAGYGIGKGGEAASPDLLDIATEK